MPNTEGKPKTTFYGRSITPGSAIVFIAAFVYFCPPIFYFFDWDAAGVAPDGWTGVALFLITFALIALDWAQYWLFEAGSSRTVIGFLCIRSFLIGLMTYFDGSEFSPFVYLVIPFYASFQLGIRAASICGVSVFLIRILVYFIFDVPDWYTQLTEQKLLVIFTIALFLVVLLGDITNKAVRFSRLEDRNRIARDIHDELGSNLAAINAQLQNALAYWDIDPTISNNAIENALDATSEAYNNYRSVVKTLRSTSPAKTIDMLTLDNGISFPSLSEALRLLIKESFVNKYTIDLDIEGEELEHEFPKHVLKEGYSIIREGLTNIERHAEATKIKLNLKFSRRKFTMELKDNGLGFDQKNIRNLSENKVQNRRGTGYGLVGIRERVEKFKGKTKIESQPGMGTSIIISIPKKI